MQMAIATPRLRDAQQAEAAGLAYSISMLLTCLPCPQRVTIMGDNLQVLRLGAGNARIRADRIWLELERALMLISAQRWPLQWNAVRRCYNAAADALATQGVDRGLRLYRDGDVRDVCHVWYNTNTFHANAWRPPTTLALHPDTQVLLRHAPMTPVPQ